MKTMYGVRAVIVLLALLVIAGALSGCGNDDKETEPTATVAVAVAPTATSDAPPTLPPVTMPASPPAARSTLPPATMHASPPAVRSTLPPVTMPSFTVVAGLPMPHPVYTDFDDPDQLYLYVPEGFMGCTDDITMVEDFEPGRDGSGTVIRITYTPRCSAGFGGVYWWYPPDNPWCEIPGDLDLSRATKLTFWAKGEVGGEIVEFKVGGLQTAAGATCDSLTRPRTTNPMRLTSEWTQYTIDLGGANLSKMTSGFVWVSNSKVPITLYLDDIQFE